MFCTRGHSLFFSKVVEKSTLVTEARAVSILVGRCFANL
jgi:hypothetical protein